MAPTSPRTAVSPTPDPTDQLVGEPTTLRALASRYSAAKLRTVEAALDLFAVHGVAGTSLQMIADSLGVTKAAVYHQFATKDAIVTAVVEVNLVPIETALEVAEQRGPTVEARDSLLEEVIRVVVGNRFMLHTLQSDPALFRILADHQPSRGLWIRLFSFLLGDGLDTHERVRAAVLSAAIGAVAHPFVQSLDDDELAAELLVLTRRLVFV